VKPKPEVKDKPEVKKDKPEAQKDKPEAKKDKPEAKKDKPEAKKDKPKVTFSLPKGGLFKGRPPKDVPAKGTPPKDEPIEKAPKPKPAQTLWPALDLDLQARFDALGAATGSLRAAIDARVTELAALRRRHQDLIAQVADPPGPTRPARP
jgi:hypothetical protein